MYLSPSLGGYHAPDLGGEAWVLENGAYWTSDGSVEIGVHREDMWTSFWAGEGFIDFQTRVSGRGRVVLNTEGPVEEIELKGEKLAVEGRQVVIARTTGLDYGIRRPSRSRLGYWLSGEELLRVHGGYGRLLLTTAPYWSNRLPAAMKR